MTVELTEDEIEVIAKWYSAAAGESYSVRQTTNFRPEYEYLIPEAREWNQRIANVLDKLGIPTDRMDEDELKGMRK